jgi:putative ABC transport system ATP-binding protein
VAPARVANVDTQLMETSRGEPIVRVNDLTKDYLMGTNVVHALHGVSLDIYPGELVAIMGASGSGKSTLMNVLGCLDRPTSGSYWLDGVNVEAMGKDDLAAVRNRKVGFIFQGFNLLPRMTARANVGLPLTYAGTPSAEVQERTMAALDSVGLADRANHRPSEMSGGQQQRVAIARALITSPSIILADEPTGNLDSRTSVEVMEILQQLNEQSITIILVTHEPDIAAYCHRVVHFRDGQIIDDQINPNPLSATAALAELQPKALEVSLS